MTNNKKSKVNKTYIFLLILAYLSFFSYLAIEIIKMDDIIKHIYPIIGCIFIFSLLISFTIMCFKNQKNSAGLINIGSLLVTCYCIVNILLLTNVISLPKDNYVPNFYNQSLLRVDEWKKANNITVLDNYEYSDTIKKDYVISQNVLPPTLTKDIKEITITISLGPDMNKEVVIQSLIGLKYDDVIKYIEDNHLSNVKIEYQKSEKTEDTVISQSNSGSLKRSDEIVITFALSNNEVGEIEIIDFTGKTKLYATSWLKKYGFKIELLEDYSDTIDEGLVINQSAKNEVKNPLQDTITLTISKGKKILAPDIRAMNVEKITVIAKSIEVPKNN